MQRILVVYDITEDKARTKIADACKDYGLDRLQFSTFSGKLSRNHQEELILQLEKLLGDGDGSIQLIPVCEADWSKRLEVNHA